MKFASRFVGLAATAAIALTTLSAAPATAAPGDATLSFAPVVVLNDNTCIDTTFGYSVELPPEGASDWYLDTTIIGPDGTEHTSQSVGTFRGDVNPGTETWQLCSDFDPVGTYTVTTRVDYRANGARTTVYGAEVVAGTFQIVRDAKSKVSLSAKRKGAKVVAKAKVSVSTGGAYGPVPAGSKVVFQKKVGKKWKKVDSASTDTAGVAKGKFKASKGTVIRAKFAGAGTVLVGSGSLPIPAATSKTVRIR